MTRHRCQFLVTAFALLALVSGVARAQDPPPPQKVFQYATRADAARVYLDFSILSGFYLYRARFGFDSGTEGAIAVAGGHTIAGVGNMVSLKDLADQKKIRLLACFGEKRHPSFPDVPTAEELGYQNAAMQVCVGIIGPPANLINNAHAVCQFLNQGGTRAGAENNVLRITAQSARWRAGE